jgi:hypothetical protein
VEARHLEDQQVSLFLALRGLEHKARTSSGSQGGHSCFHRVPAATAAWRIGLRKSAVLLLLPLLAVSTSRVLASELPISCGDDKVRFDVKTQKEPLPPPPPDAGKAQFVFIETMDKGDKYHHCVGCDATTRVGLDGAWVGADHGDSYFTLSVDPGQHSVCANWQSITAQVDSQAGVVNVNAEAGKVYYFQIAVVVHEAPNPNFTVRQMMFARLPDQSGQMLVRHSELSSWHEKN